MRNLSPWRPRKHVWHRKRPEIGPTTPIHVAIRVRKGTIKLRPKRIFRIVRTALVAASRKIFFRLIEYSVQRNHLHLIVEADDKFALSRAMRSLSIRIAKRINQVMGARGVRIVDRYFMRVLKTPLDVRTALQYVLNNYRRHEAQFGRCCADGWIDPCSSAIWFRDWAIEPRPARDRCPDLPRGTVIPCSEMLRHDWKLWGRIDPSFVPGPFRDRAKVARQAVKIGAKSGQRVTK
jgi:REP element-mobilizing transposase RayT